MCHSCRVCCTECKCSHPRGLSSPASKIGMRIYFISLSWYISLHPSSITRIEDMNIPLSHIRQYLHLTQHYLHPILRFPIATEGCESTCLHCWQASDSCQSVRSTPLFAFSPKESGHFSLYAKKYYKSIAKVLRQSQPDTFPFLSRCKPHTSWRSQGWRFPKVHRLDFLLFSLAPCSRWHGEWVGWQSIALVLQSVTKYCTSIAKCDKILH